MRMIEVRTRILTYCLLLLCKAQERSALLQHLRRIFFHGFVRAQDLLSGHILWEFPTKNVISISLPATWFTYPIRSIGAGRTHHYVSSIACHYRYDFCGEVSWNAISVHFILSAVLEDQYATKSWLECHAATQTEFLSEANNRTAEVYVLSIHSCSDISTDALDYWQIERWQLLLICDSFPIANFSNCNLAARNPPNLAARKVYQRSLFVN